VEGLEGGRRGDRSVVTSVVDGALRGGGREGESLAIEVGLVGRFEVEHGEEGRVDGDESRKERVRSGGRPLATVVGGAVVEEGLVVVLEVDGIRLHLGEAGTLEDGDDATQLLGSEVTDVLVLPGELREVVDRLQSKTRARSAAMRSAMRSAWGWAMNVGDGGALEEEEGGKD
jgi:hypothetical protein